MRHDHCKDLVSLGLLPIRACDAAREGTDYPWMLGLAAVTAAVTMVRPEWLAPTNRVWMAPGGTLVPAQRSAALAPFSHTLF